MKLRNVIAVGLSAVAAMAMLCGVVKAVDTTGQGWNDTYDAISVTVTNGSSLGLVHPKMIVTPTGGAANATNVVTLATPFPFKFPVVIYVPSTATNRLQISESAVFQHSTILLIPGTATNTVIVTPCATDIAVATR